MPKGYKDAKFIPHHKDAQGNLPPVGQPVPGNFPGGTSKSGGGKSIITKSAKPTGGKSIITTPAKGRVSTKNPY